MTHGGALYVEKDSSSTFMGTASFIGNSVISTDLPSTQTSEFGFRSNFKLRSGGAVFNKVIYSTSFWAERLRPYDIIVYSQVVLTFPAREVHLTT